jgi:hypothetical protein
MTSSKGTIMYWVQENQGLLILIGICVVVLIVLYLIFRNRFKYPYFSIKLDVSGRRKPNVDVVLQEYINTNGFTSVQSHEEQVQSWKTQCENKILKSRLSNYRRKQYCKVLDDDNAYEVSLVKDQTRYKQRNYVKTAYTVEVGVSSKTYSYAELLNIYNKLNKINFETTLDKYESKEQRKLMTQELRQKVKERDNYTCQQCGKYMPDGVGLHIDHIIPICKGGKSVISNLQVLCSKCNGTKGGR